MNKWKEKSKKIFSPLIEEKSKIYDNEIWFFGKRKKRKQRAESKWNSWIKKEKFITKKFEKMKKRKKENNQRAESKSNSWMQTEKLVWCRHWNISKDKYSK